MSKAKIDPYSAKQMYENGATVADIAIRFAVSRVAIWKAWQRIGFCTDGYRVQVKCSWCGHKFDRRRAHAQRTVKHFCSKSCYLCELRYNGLSYKPWRQGQRRARQTAARYFDLQPGNIVHHKDGNNRNNNVHNLAVFASQSDHTKWHRAKVWNVLWDGANV